LYHPVTPDKPEPILIRTSVVADNNFVEVVILAEELSASRS
jgi:hypothetical protein